MNRPAETTEAKAWLDLYLSEMSISDGHGGGITLQRVLSDDLGRIGRFVHVSRFATTFEPIRQARDRSIFLTSPFERDSMRGLIGCTASAWLLEKPMVEWWTSRSIARTLARVYSNHGSLKVFVCPQGLVSIRTLEWLKRWRPVRYVTWMMDDHIVRYRDGMWVYSNGTRELLKRHLQAAETVFVISSALGEFYRTEFGVNTVTLFGPAEVTQPPVYDAPSKDNGVRIAYFGRVWAWNQDVLASLAIAMGRGSDDELHVYAPAEPALEKLRSLPNVKTHSPIPSSTVMDKMREYDAVVIPMSFGNDLRYLTEFNIATKMSECIASGTVTIVYGPPYAAMVRLLCDKGAAIIMSDKLISGWENVAETIRNPSSRRRILNAAAVLAREELSTDVMRTRWSAATEKLGRFA